MRRRREPLRVNIDGALGLGLIALSSALFAAGLVLVLWK